MAEKISETPLSNDKPTSKSSTKTVIPVVSHSRLTSKSSREILLHFQNMFESRKNVDFKNAIDKASNVAEKDYANVYRAIDTIDEFLKKHKV